MQPFPVHFRFICDILISVKRNPSTPNGGVLLNAIQQFHTYVADLLADPKVRSMASISHHTERITCLDHSLFVSYVGFRLARLFGGDFSAVTRGGLLHDLYLSTRCRERSMFRHLIRHPEMAVRNAQSFHLTELETGIIRKHMWPVTITKIPTRREEIIVSLADKICAIAEVTGIYWRLKCRKAPDHM